MDAGTKEYAKTLNIKHYRPEDVPWRRLGQCRWFAAAPNVVSFLLTARADLYRVIEDGSNTQYRLAAIESLLPPHSDGPVFHFHEMHDEGFFVTVRIHSPRTT